MHEDIAKHAYDSIQRNGGITVNLQGVEPQEGYAYSPYPELERVYPAQAFRPEHLHQYIADNAHALSLPGNHLGGWHDQQSGNVFLDISHVGPAHPDTIQEAAKKNQIAVFDLANFNEIPTGVQRDGVKREMTSATNALTGEPMDEPDGGWDAWGGKGEKDALTGDCPYCKSPNTGSRIINPANSPDPYTRENATKHPEAYKPWISNNCHDCFATWSGPTPQVPDALPEPLTMMDTEPGTVTFPKHWAAWDWREEPEWEWPETVKPKFFTDANDHALALAKYQREHPEEWHVPDAWTRRGAADPEWLNQWIERNGPYMQHGTSADVIPAIQRDGLLPHDTEGIGSKYNNDLVPRANHVYLRYPTSHFVARDGKPTAVYVDLRKLDPHNLNADEDAFWDMTPSKVHPDFHHLLPPKAYVESSPNEGYKGVKDHAGNVYKHFGDWADKHQLNHPFHLSHSMNTGTIAHFGRIPSEALATHEQFHQWAQENGRAKPVARNDFEPGVTPIDDRHFDWRYNDADPITFPAIPHDAIELPPEAVQDIPPTEYQPNQYANGQTEQLAMPIASHSYTREDRTRLNATIWESVKLAGLIEYSVPPGTQCYFHPGVPAVAHAQVPMCADCLTRYQHSLISTNPDMRSDKARQWLSALSAWELPEGYGLMDPTSPEELAMFSLPGRLKQYEECPSCGAYTTMPLGGCPHCGYEKPVLTTQEHQRAAGVWDQLN